MSKDKIYMIITNVCLITFIILIYVLIFMGRLDKLENKIEPNPIHQKDTVYVYGVSIRYGTRDTIFQMYPIDSAEVAVGYLKSNGALKD
jgi:hypothetical protein